MAFEFSVPDEQYEKLKKALESKGWKVPPKTQADHVDTSHRPQVMESNGEEGMYLTALANLAIRLQIPVSEFNALFTDIDNATQYLKEAMVVASKN